MTLSLISIIIPVYNKEAAIEKCIKSIVAQSLPNWELLLIDDGSTDNSRTIIAKYLSDPRISYYRKSNGGVSSARNMGLDKASGDWIIFLDADDYFESDALEVLCATASEYNTKVAIGNFVAVKDGKFSICCSGWRSHRIRNNFRSWYFQSIFPRTGTILFRRELVNNHRFDEHLSRYEDVVFFATILRSNTASYTPQIVMRYMMQYRSLSKQTYSIQKDYIFHLDFTNKSFWEKMVLAVLLNEGLIDYNQHYKTLCEKYKRFLIYTYIDCKIRRLKHWRKRIYQLISKLHCNETYSQV